MKIKEHNDYDNCNSIYLLNDEGYIFAGTDVKKSGTDYFIAKEPMTEERRYIGTLWYYACNKREWIEILIQEGYATKKDLMALVI